MNTIQGHWPAILGPVSMRHIGVDAKPKRAPKHFRVIAGPVDSRIVCGSVEEFREKVPKATSTMLHEVEYFFGHPSLGGQGGVMLEVVPS